MSFLRYLQSLNPTTEIGETESLITFDREMISI